MEDILDMNRLLDALIQIYKFGETCQDFVVPVLITIIALAGPSK